MQLVCNCKCGEVKPEQFNGKDSDEEDDNMDNEVDELAEPTQEIIQPIGCLYCGLNEFFEECKSCNGSTQGESMRC